MFSFFFVKNNVKYSYTMDQTTETTEVFSTPNTYQLKVGSFEGPLDLILQLIESRKLFINEISLAEIANDYISYIRSLSSYNLLDTTHFVIIASTLVLIKSRSLLPNLDLTKDEENKIVNLEDRLKLYQIVKDISEKLSQFSKKRTLYERQAKEKDTPIFVPEYTLTTEVLRQNIVDVFRIKNDEEKKEKLHEVEIRRVMSIDEMMKSLEERIQRAFTFKWSDIRIAYPDATEKEVRVHTIVSFLALLELVRNGIIDVLQSNLFEDMTISAQENQSLQNTYE